MRSKNWKAFSETAEFLDVIHRGQFSSEDCNRAGFPDGAGENFSGNSAACVRICRNCRKPPGLWCVTGHADNPHVVLLFRFPDEGSHAGGEPGCEYQGADAYLKQFLDGFP